MLQPRFLGGAELRPVLFTQVTEALAQTNASVGWCVGQNNGCSMTAAYLDREVACEMFGPPTGILAWGPPGAPYEAQPVDGGYRISGKWRFASGCHHARWLGAHMPVAGNRQGAHHAVPEIQRADERHLAHHRPARHRQQRIRGEGPVRAAALLHLARQSGRAAGGRAAVSFHQQPAVFLRLRRRRPGDRARHDQRLPRPAGQQGVARRVAADAREQRGAVAACAVRGAVAVGARVPAHHVGDGLGARRGHRRSRPPRIAR